MGIDEIVHLAVDARLRQRIDYDLTLPGAIGVRSPVLNGAAAAASEMRTERRDAFRVRCLHAKKPRTIRMASDRLGVDDFAAERVRHEHRLFVKVRDAVAAMPDVIDGQAFSHGAHPGKIQYCRRHR